MNYFGELIHLRRDQLGLTLKQVGEACGVGASTVRKWETGMIESMKQDKLARLAKVLHLDPLELIFEGHELPQPPLILTVEEKSLIHLYRDADERAQQDAVRILMQYPKKG